MKTPHRLLDSIPAGLAASLVLFVVVVPGLTAGTAVAATGATPDATAAGRVSFRNDVMAAISKAGCNLGTCHGNKNGKGGLRLSLRGDDPEFDFDILARDFNSRRVNVLDADRSLILLKPTMQIPHEGGRRFTADSELYRVLRDWIAQGSRDDGTAAPRVTALTVTPTEQVLQGTASSVQLSVQASFSDGTERDVTGMAVYEPSQPIVSISPDGLVEPQEFGAVSVIVRFLDRQVPVRLAFIPERPGFVWSDPPTANVVDEHVFARLKDLQVNPAGLCSDDVFLRRAYVDLLGVLPTADEARQFVADTDPEKRAKLIERLFARPEFADSWALRWSDLLRNEEKTLDFKGVQHFHAWIRRAIAENRPLDQFVRELVASRGSTYTSPEANYYRAMRDPITRAESTAQLFLGVRVQCAKCHNHPFDRWTQDDYYSWANLFARVDYKILENARRDRNDKHEFDGEQVVFMKSKGEVTNPRIGRPSPSRFLGSETEVPDQDDRLERLADWLTASDNRMFARAQANRIWAHLMGRGIVEPIDDVRDTNPPSHPELLEALADELVTHGYDMRHLIRLIMQSRTYQLASAVADADEAPDALFARAIVRRLSAEQLLDAIAHATGASVRFNGYPQGVRAGQLAGVRAVRSRERAPSPGDAFLSAFGKPPRLQSCECERSNDATLAQTFQLISGPLVNELLSQSGNRISRLLQRDADPAAIADELWWTALSRAPTAAEREAAALHVAQSGSPQAGWEDVLWAILNSNEFLLRR